METSDRQPFVHLDLREFTWTNIDPLVAVLMNSLAAVYALRVACFAVMITACVFTAIMNFYANMRWL